MRMQAKQYILKLSCFTHITHITHTPFYLQTENGEKRIQQNSQSSKCESFCPQLPIRGLCHVGHFQFVGIHGPSFSCLPGNLHSVSSGIPELSPSLLQSLFPEFWEAHCWQITHLSSWTRGQECLFSCFPLALLFLFFFSPQCLASPANLFSKIP